MALFVRPVAPSNIPNYNTEYFGANCHSSSELMTTMEPYQYPAPPESDAADTNVPQQLTYGSTTYPMPYQKPQSGNLGEIQDSSSSGFSHNQPYHPSDPNHVLKRSFSTPSVGMPSPVSSEQQPATGPPGEKKRNKLGYHRTSIACSHCRRRKIRCIASTEVQNRCTNCIRLKKECSFYPVEQQPTSDGRLPTQTTLGGSNAPLMSPSPALLDQQPYAPMPATPMPNVGNPTPQGRGAEYFSSDPKSSLVTLPTDLSYGIREPAVGWMMTDANGNPIPKNRDQNLAWRAYPLDSPMNGQFPPYLHTSSGSTSWTPSDTERSGEAMGWDNMPSLERSTSYGGEVLGSQQMPQYFPMNQDQSGDRQQASFASSGLYSPTAVGVPLDRVDAAGAGQSIDITAGSLVAGAVPPTNPLSWQQSQHLMSQQQSQHGAPDSRRRGDYEMWNYGDGAGSHQM